jgi:Tfp pilus assembly protein PilN
VRAVNLLPRDEAPKSFEKNRGVAFGAAGGAALVTVGMVALLLSAGGTVTEQQAQVEALQAELASIPDATENAEAAAENAAISSELSKRTNALSSVLGGRIAWDAVLRQVSLVLPTDVWLTGLTTTAPDESDAAPGESTVTSITLQGATYAQSGVARLLSRLSVAPVLTNVRLQSSTLAESGSAKLVQFTILADVRTAGDAS